MVWSRGPNLGTLFPQETQSSLMDDAFGSIRPVSRPLRSVDFLVFAACCGLGGGLLEVGVRALARLIDPSKRLDLMTRHFLWLTPLSSLIVFIPLGLLLAVLIRISPKRLGWVAPRIVVLLAILPALMVISRQIYLWAWVILAGGIAERLISVLRRLTRPRRYLLFVFFVFMGVTGLLGSSIMLGDRLAQSAEDTRELPPPGTPNVILIVLDTVRADHLSLLGYNRPTTPVLTRLAERGILFDRARSTAPWTLASHASLFTGRFPHELGVEWMTPLRHQFRTLGESLGASGYATAGFVANTHYCSRDTGLDRGFTHYDDYVLRGIAPFRTSWLVDVCLHLALDTALLFKNHAPSWIAAALPDAWLQPLFAMDRKKSAAEVNGEFLRWLDDRPSPSRPFLAFLNFLDAHTPYILPSGEPYRFGLKPRSQADFELLVEHWTKIDRTKLSAHYQAFARDCYDNCIAYLDNELGRLFDDLGRRGILGNSLIIVTSDHGEGFGEHELFDHGESLYSTEIHVPLVIVPPGGIPAKLVSESVSLRDVPATILELVGTSVGGALPGRSLARYWQEPTIREPDLVLSEHASANLLGPNVNRSPAAKGPLVSLAENSLVYIRNQRTGREELFDTEDDPRELTSRVADPRFKSRLARLRQRLDSVAGPARRP